MTKRLQKERKILDTETSILEVVQHSTVNFLFGFTSGIVIAFVSLFLIALQNKESVLLSASMLSASYFIFKQLESKVLNRNKYTSRLGKNYIFPIPSTIGFVLGVFISSLI